MKFIHPIILLFILMVNNTSAQDSWSFVSSPDWHTGDRELRHPAKPYSQEDIALQQRTIDDMKECKPELLLIAGDLCGGPWIGDAWTSIYGMGGSQADAIINVSDIIYKNLKQRFTKNGFDKILVAIGDHEIGEDGNWKPGSVVSQLLPVYRDGFQRIWNRDKQGDFIYSNKIGRANSRPLGTPWENTSYAYKYKNVLFLTIDIFNQPYADKPVGYMGKSINADMPEPHLFWFENVLKEARKDVEIKHIIVQAHTPVLAPVRGRRSSMIYTEYGENSSFWQVMTKYGVDLYLAGEVHTPSAQRERGGFPIQVVHGDYAGRNYLRVEVFNDKLVLDLREKGVNTISSIGQIIIDKSQEEKRVEDKGMLKFINSEEALVHYTFDEKAHEVLPNMVQSGKNYDINTVVNNEVIPNMAQMDKYYNLITNADLTKGIMGKAIKLDNSSITETSGYGVMTLDHPSTSILWLRTSQNGVSHLVSHGHGLQFNLALNRGRLAVYTAANSCLIVEESKINDGKWHQVAVVVPEFGSSLSEVKLFIDGKQMETLLLGNDRKINIVPTYRMKVGGSNFSTNKIISDLNFQNFTGTIDEFSVWHRALSEKEIGRAYSRIIKQIN